MPSAQREASGFGGSSSYQSSPYGLSSTSGMLARWAAATTASRRSAGITRPVGFWKFGSTYMKRVPCGNAAMPSGSGPSASPGTDANFGSFGLKACNAPR